MKRTIISGVLMAAIALAWASYALAQESKAQVGKKVPAAQKAAERGAPALYTCATHPSVKATWAGKCPHCGQALAVAKKAKPAASAGWVCPWWTSGQPKQAKSNVQHQGCGHWFRRLVPGHRGRCSWRTDGQAGGCGSCW